MFILLVSCGKNAPTIFPCPGCQLIVPIDLVISPDSVLLNPYGYTPLSAIIRFSSKVYGKAVMIVQGKHGADTDIKHAFEDKGYSHAIQVTGLYSNYLNTVKIRLINDQGDTLAKTALTIQTGSLPPNLPTSIQPDILPNERSEKGLNLVSNLSAQSPHIPLLVDNYGEIRWVLDYSSSQELRTLSYDNGIQRLKNGNFVFGNLSTNRIYEVDVFGKILRSWDLNKAGYIFHHDIYEKPDGNFIASVSKPNSINSEGLPTNEDYIIEIDRKTEVINNVWDLKKSLNPYRTVINSDLMDWIHVNSVMYDSTDNTIIVSGRHQGVIKLTYNNKVKWIIGTHTGWGRSEEGVNLDNFLLTPLAANGSPITDTAVLNGSANHRDFEWCWYQHSVIKLPNGDYMLFDNGTTRNFNNLAPKYSRVVEYRIDPVKMTIQQKWQYGKERGLDTYSSIISSVQFLPNTNHVLFCPGYQVVNSNGKGGKIVEIDYPTRQLVAELSVSAANNIGFHRTKRVGAYPN